MLKWGSQQVNQGPSPPSSPADSFLCESLLALHSRTSSKASHDYLYNCPASTTNKNYPWKNGLTPQPHPGSLVLKAQLRDWGLPLAPTCCVTLGHHLPASGPLQVPGVDFARITLEAPWKPGQSEFQLGLFSAQVPPQVGCMSSGKSPPLSVPGASLSWGRWHRRPRKVWPIDRCVALSQGGLGEEPPTGQGSSAGAMRAGAGHSH